MRVGMKCGSETAYMLKALALRAVEFCCFPYSGFFNAPVKRGRFSICLFTGAIYRILRKAAEECWWMNFFEFGYQSEKAAGIKKPEIWKPTDCPQQKERGKKNLNHTVKQRTNVKFRQGGGNSRFRA